MKPLREHNQNTGPLLVGSSWSAVKQNILKLPVPQPSVLVPEAVLSTTTMSGLRWRSDLNKLVITSNLEARGWQAARNEDEWDIWWASVNSVQQLFAPNSLVKLRPGQLVNHFPNHYELTHKVCAVLISRCSVYAHRAAVSS